MRLSTFASRISAHTAFATLIVALLVYAVCLEAASRVVVPRISEGISTLEEDYPAAVALQRLDPSGRPTVLMVGNSLLLEGVDRTTLAAKTPPIAVSLFPIEGTSYFDWYYGMKRYFVEGSRPSMIGLCINARQLLFDTTNGEGFAYYMMQIQDFAQIRRSTALDSMTASNYFFAHWSKWLATRANVRVGLLERLLPSSRILAPYFGRAAADTPQGELVASRMVERLQHLRDLTETYGAKLVWISPPAVDQQDPAPLVQALGRAQGVRVLVPVYPGTMSAELFADGLHLNREGARVFTERLAPELVLATQQP